MRSQAFFLTILCLSQFSCSDRHFIGSSGKKTAAFGSANGGGQGGGQEGANASKSNHDNLDPDIDNGRTGLGAHKIPTKEEIQEVLSQCESTKQTLKETKQTIIFPQRTSTCRFGILGNLPKRQAYITAYEPNLGNLEVPKGTICAIQIKSAPVSGKAVTELRYDDFLSITLDGDILFFSNNSWMNLFEQHNGIYLWQFSKIVGQAIGSKFEAPQFCLAKNGSCQFPGHDKVGSVNLNLPLTDIAPIAAKLRNRSSVSLNVNVTGDDNDTDCIHTPLALEVMFQYAP